MAGDDGVETCSGEVAGTCDDDGVIVPAERAEVDGVGGIEVAITKNVVRSNRTTSVAPHAAARVVRCLESTEAFGISVCTICDHA